MNKSDAKDFCNYEVYEYVGEEYHTICACKDHKTATIIAQVLAQSDEDNDSYYVTSINNPGDLVWGGGWYEQWFKDKSGKLKCVSLM